MLLPTLPLSIVEALIKMIRIELRILGRESFSCRAAGVPVLDYSAKCVICIHFTDFSTNFAKPTKKFPQSSPYSRPQILLQN